MATDIVHITFPPAAREIFTDLALDLERRRFDPYRAEDTEQIRRLAGYQFNRLLPPDMLHKLCSAYAMKQPIVLHGCPIDRQLPLALDEKPHATKTRVSEMSWLGLAFVLGLRAAVTPGNGSEMIEQVIPRPQASDDPVSFSSSSVRFNWHNDGANYAHLPEAVSLYFLRGQAEAENRFIRTADIVALLDASTVATLKEPHFSTCKFYTAQQCRNQYPMLSEDADGLILRLGNLRANTPEAKEAKQRVYDAIATLEARGQYLSFSGHTGDCVILPNRQFIHNRSAFKQMDPEAPRWVQMGMLRDATQATGQAR